MAEAENKEMLKTASLDYESEYNRLKGMYARSEEVNAFLRSELQCKERELQWHYGFKEAVEMIFRVNENGC